MFGLRGHEARIVPVFSINEKMTLAYKKHESHLAATISDDKNVAGVGEGTYNVRLFIGLRFASKIYGDIDVIPQTWFLRLKHDCSTLADWPTWR